MMQKIQTTQTTHRPPRCAAPAGASKVRSDDVDAGAFMKFCLHFEGGQSNVENGAKDVCMQGNAFMQLFLGYGAQRC